MRCIVYVLLTYITKLIEIVWLRHLARLRLFVLIVFVVIFFCVVTVLSLLLVEKTVVLPRGCRVRTVRLVTCSFVVDFHLLTSCIFSAVNIAT